MIPEVEISPPGKGEPQVDRRKARKVKGTEARLCLAHEPGSVTPVFGASLAVLGGPEEAGAQLLHCAIRAGAGTATKLHCVGDGAWSRFPHRSEEHTSELQSRVDLVCRLL